MRVQKRIPWLCSLGMGLAALGLWGTQAGADVTSDRPGSIVIWPKVIADGTRDTLITLTNTSNNTVHAHCWYTEGVGHCSLTPDYCNLPTSDSCPQVGDGSTPNVCVFDLFGDLGPCATKNFDVTLTRQQPTIWRVSTGRVQDIFLNSGTACTAPAGIPPTQSCPGFWDADPPPVTAFRGELRCVETQVDFATPLAADALKGEATIEGVNTATTGGALLSEYNSINILAANAPNLDPLVLELNGFQGYDACPGAVDIIHYSNGASDLSADSVGADCSGDSCKVQTHFTIVPCRRDFEGVTATTFNPNLVFEDEFESSISVPPNRGACWLDVDVDASFPRNIAGSTFMRTRATSSGTLCIAGPNLNSLGCHSDADCGTPDGVCAPASGILAVVEEFHSTTRTASDPSLVGSAAANAHSVDTIGSGSVERLGLCRGSLTPCSDNGGCATGLCRQQTTKVCTASPDCSGDDSACTGAGKPAICCTGVQTGTCSGISGDFCDRCMNDEITLSPAP